MVAFPVVPLMECTIHNMLECVVIWMTLMLEINVELPNFSNWAIGIINFERLSIADTMNWFLNPLMD